jgi:hypothetical protein
MVWLKRGKHHKIGIAKRIENILQTLKNDQRLRFRHGLNFFGRAQPPTIETLLASTATSKFMPPGRG